MEERSGKLATLVETARALGTSDARVKPAETIQVEDRLARLCEPPQCAHYGLTIHCPPHGMRPAAFRSSLSRYEHALVFKIDAPTWMLLGEDRDVVARLVHEVAARLEAEAKAMDYHAAWGLAAGSCKRIFCGEQLECQALHEQGGCLFPHLARPSMSGLGINFFALARTLGRRIDRITRDTDAEVVPMGMLAGMVLIG